MARFIEPTTRQLQAWREWTSGLPGSLREVAERFDPWTLYRMKSTGQRVTLCSLDGNMPGYTDITLTVCVSGEFNLTAFDRQVFGVDPGDLEACDLPAPGEPLGAALTKDEVANNIDSLRVLVRPDLWVLDANGKARRKN